MPKKELVQKELTVTTLADLEKYAAGTLVELPPFAEGQPFVARMRRPSMLQLVKEGQIPNALIASANKLFYKGGNVTEAELQDEKLMSNMLDAIRPLIASALIEPTLDDVEAAGLHLTDDQTMFIFNYTQEGVNALKDFRK